MKIGIFSDPHIGLQRRSGMTASTSNAFKKLLVDVAVNRASTLASSCGFVACLGDLFDTFSNAEEDILSASRVTGYCDMVLAGNHDVANVVGKKSSLELLDKLGSNSGKIVMSPDPSTPFVHSRSLPGCIVVAIPHCLSQKIFEESIDIAIKKVEEEGQDKKAYLFLHCNVRDPIGEKSEATLYLTDLLKEKTEASFTLTFVGHEHDPVYLRGSKKVPIERAKTIVVGNTFPVSFGELGNRALYYLDSSTGKVEVEEIDLQSSYTTLQVEEVLSLKEIKTMPTFVRVEGTVAYDQAAKFRASLYKLKTCDGVLLIKNDAVIEGPTKKSLSVENAKTKTVSEILEELALKAGFSDLMKEFSDVNS